MNHNGVNNIHFNPFKPEELFVGLGDGGLANDPFENAQNLNKILGKILVFNTSMWTNRTMCDFVVCNELDLYYQTYMVLVNVPSCIASCDFFLYCRPTRFLICVSTVLVSLKVLIFLPMVSGKSLSFTCNGHMHSKKIFL